MSPLDLFSTPARQASVLSEVEHRTWPIPRGPWLLAQTLDDLLFAHWRVPADAMRGRVAPLELDTYEGDAWLGITPFVVNGLRLRGLLPLPRLSSFPQLNVRTYVTVEDKPGIVFFSVDAASPLAVEAARRMYRLPYFRTRMSSLRRDTWIEYSSAREDAERPYVLSARYRPTDGVFNAVPGSLDAFLTERYCLYTVDGEDVFRAEIHHPPWPLRPAEAEFELNTMPPDGIELREEKPLLHYVARQDVVIWPLARL